MTFVRFVRAARTPAVLALALALVAGTPAGAVVDPPGAKPAGARVVRGPGGIGVVAPPPGRWVGATFDLADGRSLTLRVDTSLDGVVSVIPAREAAAAAAGAASTAACGDPAHSFLGGRWYRTLAWHYDSRLAPAMPSLADSEAALRDGIRNITLAANDCGRPDDVGATASYRGRAAFDPGVLGTLCLGADGNNVVAWGPMPPPVLAGTCNYGLGSEILETDILLNRLVSWYRTRPVACVHDFDLTSVMTHEWGHSFGLGHVAEDAHPELTMSEATSACDGSASSLGLGDLLGLEALY